MPAAATNSYCFINEHRSSSSSFSNNQQLILRNKLLNNNKEVLNEVNIFNYHHDDNKEEENKENILNKKIFNKNNDNNLIMKRKILLLDNKHQQLPLLINANSQIDENNNNFNKLDSEKERNLRFKLDIKNCFGYILPSTYAKCYFPSSLYRFLCYISYLFWFTVGVLVLRKTRTATAAMFYVKNYGSSVSLNSIEQSTEFASLLKQIDKDNKPPSILMLNQYALNMTFNFLCNTAIFPGVHERFIFVTLDEKSHQELKKYWPNIKQFYWPTPSLYKQFSFAEGPYQLIYILRANLALALIKKGKSFWMQQQDTFWRKNLFDINLEQKLGFDLLFDQIGYEENSKRAEWVNGANFYVKANKYTQEFFEAIATKLSHWYTPDMGIMIHQCHTWKTPHCEYIPHLIANSWEWMYTEQKNPPYIMQLDCETDGRSKLQQLARFGFYFTESDGRTCNKKAVHKAQQAMERGEVDIGKGPVRLSWGRFQFKVYWWLVDYILCTPCLGSYLKPYLPLVGYILMFTVA
uniref:Nucleotide-diphospho-sugar transferase domain-containing protein n=1 Tax=Meloidogyne enterolobii TaxID=390850 RepID=A0A6V7TZ47_MELEN|nr:unnamed protein product [Meloidogyne enterolobii]